MAITGSLGYAGSMSESDIPRWGWSFAGEYGVVGPDDWRVTAKTGVDRSVGVAAGDGWSRGVIDSNVGEVVLTHDTQGTGTRWDLVVARRTRSGPGGSTAFAIVKGSTGQLSPLALRGTDPTSGEDQPLALVSIVGGSGGGQIGQVVDMRVWQANGAVAATSELVLQYLNAPGTEVLIGRVRMSRVIDSTGTPVWIRSYLAPESAPLITAIGIAEAQPGNGLVVNVPGCSVTLPGGENGAVYSVQGTISVRAVDQLDTLCAALYMAGTGAEVPGSRGVASASMPTGVPVLPFSVTTPTTADTRVAVPPGGSVSVGIRAIPNGSSTLRAISSAGAPVATLRALYLGQGS